MTKIDWLDHLDPNALEWAKLNAANRIESGPSGEKLTDDLRRTIRATLVDALERHHSVKQLAHTLESQFGFNFRQSAVIAHDEIKTAFEQGAFYGAKATFERIGAQAEKCWLLSNDPGVCDACAANAAQGYIPINRPFASGHLAPPGCYGCRCGGAYRRARGV